jgi:WhiB family redox-sensing transcriptional regulator
LADAFFPGKGAGTAVEANLARRTCGRCYVRVECLTWAITTRQPSGIYGGLSEAQRRKWAVTDDGDLYEKNGEEEAA